MLLLVRTNPFPLERMAINAAKKINRFAWILRCAQDDNRSVAEVQDERKGSFAEAPDDRKKIILKAFLSS
jgi:hypothetical protein